MSKILITGASGFIGKSLFKNLKEKKKYIVQLSMRTDQEKIYRGTKVFNVGEIDSKTNWHEAVTDVDCIIHCAARAHVMKKMQKDLTNNYQKINVLGTINLANQAVAHGVKRFIFLSSIKVNGEKTIGSSSFKYNDIPKPNDPYSISKWEAEKALFEISKQTGLEIVIIRAPLVYGENVSGNFFRLLNLVYEEVPLPFAKIDNLRSFIGLDNLIDLLIRCIDHPKAAGKTFLVSDAEDISTSDLLKKLSKYMRKSSRLFPIPLSLIKLVSSLIGKYSESERLLSSLRVDSSYTNETLGWKPLLNLDEGLAKVVNWYLINR